MADDDITIRLGLENELSRPAREASEDIADIGREADKTTAELEAMRLEMARIKSLQKAMQPEINRYNNERRRQQEAEAATAKAIKNTEAETKKLAATEKKAAADRKKADDDLKKQLNTFDKYAKKIVNLSNLMKILKFGAIFTAIKAVAGGIASLGAGLFVTIQKLLPLTGLLSAIPALALTAAQSMGALKLATAGFGAALTNLTSAQVDYEALNKSLAQLSPNAQSALYQLAALNTEYIKPMQSNVQDAFWGQVTQSFGNLGNILPTINQGLTGTGAALGAVVKNALATVSTPLFSSDLATVMDTNNQLIGKLGDGVINLATAFLHFMVLARPFLLWLGQAFDDNTKKVNAWIHSFDGENSVITFLGKTQKEAQDLAHIVSNLVLIFIAWGQAATGATGSWGDSLSNMTDKWLVWSRSLEGQNKLAKFFQDSMLVLREFGSLLGAIVKMFGSIGADPGLAQLFNMIRTQLVPALSAAFAQSNGGESFSQVIISIATSFVQLSTALAGPLSSTLYFVAKTLAWVASLPPGLLIFVGVLATIIRLTVMFYKALVFLEWALKALGLAELFAEAPLLPFIAIAAAVIAATALLIYYFMHFSQVNQIVGNTLKSLVTEVANFIIWWELLPIKLLQALGNDMSGFYSWGVSIAHSIINGIKKGATSWIPFVGDGSTAGAGTKILNNAPGQAPAAGTSVVKAPGNTTRWSGGNVFPLKNYLVGEKGIEGFKDSITGKLSAIGANGPKQMQFKNPGTVIPNHIYAKMQLPDATVPTPRAQLREPQVSGPAGSASRHTYVEGESHYNAPITVQGLSPAQVEKVVRNTFRKMEIEKKTKAENIIHWGGR